VPRNTVLCGIPSELSDVNMFRLCKSTKSLVQHVSLNNGQNTEHCIRCWSTDISVCKTDDTETDSAFKLPMTFYFTFIGEKDGRDEQLKLEIHNGDVYNIR
jgi:hypothetical protein